MPAFTFGHYVRVLNKHITFGSGEFDSEKIIDYMELNTAPVQNRRAKKENPDKKNDPMRYVEKIGLLDLARFLLFIPSKEISEYKSQYIEIVGSKNSQVSQWCSTDNPKQIPEFIRKSFRHPDATEKIESALLSYTAGYTNENAMINEICEFIQNDNEIPLVEKNQLIEQGNNWKTNIDNDTDSFMIKVLIMVVEKSEMPNHLDEALVKYKKYIETESKMEMSPRGLPANIHSILQNPDVENLFIPLRFSRISDYENQIHSEPKEHTIKDLIPDSGSFVRVVLSGPGGGKTTLMKRLISAYGLEKISDENVKDNLPSRKLFPVIIRCNDPELWSGKLSILSILGKVLSRSKVNFSQDQNKALVKHISNLIKKGTALILIDGVDEISDNEKREGFMGDVITFIKKNPKVNIIISTRIVSFGQLAKNLRITKQITCWIIRPFEKEDIECFCKKWYRVLVPKNENNAEAEKLINAITSNKNTSDIAKTPILLTTLFLVNKKHGKLPSRRAELYGDCLEVLLFTWNTEKYPPVSRRDALPQLAYLAYHMFFNGQRMIEKKDLCNILSKARNDMDHLVIDETVQEYIDRVEERSAVLVKRGNHAIEGRLETIEDYEFQHSTFIEYLAAYAITKGHFPNAVKDPDKRVCGCFNGFWEDNTMREVIIFTATIPDEGYNGPEAIADTLINKIEAIEAKNETNSFERLIYLRSLLLQIYNEKAVLSRNHRENIQNICKDISD